MLEMFQLKSRLQCIKRGPTKLFECMCVSGVARIIEGKGEFRIEKRTNFKKIFKNPSKMKYFSPTSPLATPLMCVK